MFFQRGPDSGTVIRTRTLGMGSVLAVSVEMRMVEELGSFSSRSEIMRDSPGVTLVCAGGGVNAHPAISSGASKEIARFMVFLFTQHSALSTCFKKPPAGRPHVVKMRSTGR